MQKRIIDNEIGDLREREGKRVHTEKATQHATVQEALDEVAEKLEGQTTVEKKATLAANYKAALQALKAKEAEEKKAQAKAKAKARTTPKAKADRKKAKRAEEDEANEEAPREEDEAKDEAPREEDEANEEAPRE